MRRERGGAAKKYKKERSSWSEVWRRGAGERYAALCERFGDMTLFICFSYFGAFCSLFVCTVAPPFGVSCAFLHLPSSATVFRDNTTKLPGSLRRGGEEGEGVLCPPARSVVGLLCHAPPPSPSRAASV